MAGIGAAVQATRSSLTTAFRNPALRKLNLALAGSMIGDWAYATAIAVWAYDVGGAVAVGVWGTVRLSLGALFALLGSALADRMSRKTVMIACDVVRAVLVAAAAVAVASDAPAAVVFVLATLSPLVGTPFRPAQMALTPSLVNSPDELTAANGVASTLESLAFFVGPALGGLLLAVADVSTVFVLNSATFVWSALLVAGLRLPAPSSDKGGVGADREAAEEPSGTGEEAGFLAESLAGFGVIWRNRDLRLVTGLYCAQTVVAGASFVFTVTIAFDVTDLGPAGVGYLDATLGIGALFGGLLAVALAPRHRLASHFGIGVALWALPLLLVAIWPEAAAAFIAMAVIGVANPIVDVNASTILQRIAPDAVLGRVFGALESGLIATMALGSLLMPLLIGGPGLRWGLTVIAVPIVLAALAALPRLRVLDGAVGATPEAGLLAGVSLFQPLAQPMLEQLSGRLTRLVVPAGETVIIEGAIGDRFFVIQQGRLDARHDGRVLSSMGPGDHFGEIALLHDIPRTATVTAIEDSVLLAMERADFLAAMTGDPDLRARTEIVATRRLANT
ncbi:MAG: MFS transporter [Actinomycetes bacterium]